MIKIKSTLFLADAGFSSASPSRTLDRVEPGREGEAYGHRDTNVDY